MPTLVILIKKLKLSQSDTQQPINWIYTNSLLSSQISYSINITPLTNIPDSLMHSKTTKIQQFKGNLKRILSESKPSPSAAYAFASSRKPAQSPFCRPTDSPLRRREKHQRLGPITISKAIKEMSLSRNQSSQVSKKEEQNEKRRADKISREDKKFEYMDVEVQKEILKKKKEKESKRRRIKTVLDRYDSNHYPKNASHSLLSSYQPLRSSMENYEGTEPQDPSSPTLQKSSSHSPQKLLQMEEHLSFDEMVHRRIHIEEASRMVVLKKVIFENVKRKNKQMLIKSKKKVMSII